MGVDWFFFENFSLKNWIWIDDVTIFQLWMKNVGIPCSGGFRGGDGGDASPPTSLKVTIFAEKSASVSNNSDPFRDASPPTDLNVTNPAKNHSQFWWTPFFFGDHLILGEKNVWSSDFGRKITLNFGEDIRIFEVLCFKSPPTKIFWIRHWFHGQYKQQYNVQRCDTAT